MSNPVTALYVPGDRPEWFDRAVSSGAEMVIFDLEDAVAPSAKSVALAAVVDWLNTGDAQGLVIQVRVNSGVVAELSGLSQTVITPEIRLPKVESSVQLDTVLAVAPHLMITPLIESALGVENLNMIAQHPAVTRLALGESDLASNLGSKSSSVMDYARIRLRYAAAAAALPAPMLSAYPQIKDLTGLFDDTIHGKQFGFYGRVAVHPKQIPVISKAFEVGSDETAWAHEVISVMAGGGVVTLSSGEMVDSAMLGRAQKILGIF